MATVTHRIQNRLTLDRQAGYLAALFLFIQTITVYLTQQLVASGADLNMPAGTGPDATATEAATAGAAWAGLEVVLAIVMLGVALVYKRLPEWAQKMVKANAAALVLLHFGGQWGKAGVLPAGALIVVTWITVLFVTDHFDVWWLVNDILSVIIAITVGVLLAYIFGVWGLAVALVALTVYDHLFADRQSWMFDIAALLLAARVPIIFFKPPTWRYGWSNLTDEDVETEPDRAWGIGTADLALPAAFASAVAVAPTGGLVTGGILAAAGVVVGTAVACARLRYELLTGGSGAGLPALSGGMLVGFLALQLPLAAVQLV